MLFGNILKLSWFNDDLRYENTIPGSDTHKKNITFFKSKKKVAEHLTLIDKLNKNKIF